MLFEWHTARWIAAAAVALALLAWFGDRRRMRRRDPDAVGWVPWTTVFFWGLAVGCVFAGLTVSGWLRG